MLKIWAAPLFLLLTVFTCLSYAEVAIEGETEYVDLIQGVYTDKKFEDLPDKSVFKFENTKFQKYVDLIYDNDRKVIRFKPKRKGSVTIRFVNKKDPDLIIKQIKVTVQESNLDKVATEVKSLLGEIEGIEIKVINNKVIVDGYILLAKDLNRIAMVLNQYSKDQVVSIVRLSPLTRKKIAERIEIEIDNPNIYVTVINDYFILEGSESYRGESKRAEEIAQAHVSDILSKVAEKSDRGGSQILSVRKASNPIINNIAAVRAAPPQPKKMIQIVVHYVELSKSYGKGFNFEWAPTLTDTGSITVNGASTSGSNLLSSLTATITNLLPRLNWAKDHGHARVLNTLNVLTTEGVQGVVDAKRTIVRTESGISGIVQKDINANIKTEVTPTLNVAERDSVDMQIVVEVGEITEVSEAGDQTSSNRVQTTLTVRNKHSAAIGGILRSSSSTTYNRSPAANAFFRFGASKNLTRAKSQFVIFVTPIIKSNASEGIDRIKRKFRLDK